MGPSVDDERYAVKAIVVLWFCWSLFVFCVAVFAFVAFRHPSIVDAHWSHQWFSYVVCVPFICAFLYTGQRLRLSSLLVILFVWLLVCYLSGIIPIWQISFQDDVPSPAATFFQTLGHGPYFFPATSAEGMPSGYVFTKGEQGLGWYKR